jgi:fimbrial chaperone protein
MRRILGFVIFMLPALAMAASLDVDPIRVDFTGQNTVTVLTLTNSGDGPATVQLEPVSWSQANGDDVYSSTREILATPPIFTVQPHAKQVIRLGLRVPPDALKERSYRLYLDEVPQPSQVKGLGVVMALRIGIPVFVQPTAPSKPDLQWTLRHGTGKTLDLSVTNAGGSHVQIRQLSLSAPKMLTIVVQQAAYVLPGSTRTWVLNQTSLPADGTTVQVVGDTDIGTVNGQVVLK